MEKPGSSCQNNESADPIADLPETNAQDHNLVLNRQATAESVEIFAPQTNYNAAASGSNLPTTGEDTLTDSMLQYISNIMMDEDPDERNCMMQAWSAYQAMAKGFYDLLGEGTSSLNLCLNSSHVSCTVETPCERSTTEELVKDVDLFPKASSAASMDGLRNGFPQSIPAQISIQRSSGPSWSYASSGSKIRLSSQCSFANSAGSSSQSDRLPDSSLLNFNPHDDIFWSDVVPQKDDILNINSSNNNIFRLLHDDNAEFENLGSTLESNQLSAGAMETLLLGERSMEENITERDLKDVIQYKDHVRERGWPASFPANMPLPSRQWNPEESLSYVRNEDLNAKFHSRIGRDEPPEAATSEFRRAESCKQVEYGAVDEGLGASPSGKRPTHMDLVDLRRLLISTAQAIASNDLIKAQEILMEVQRHATPQGGASERLAYYFAEALVARLSGTGARLYAAMSNNRPSAAQMLKAYYLVVDACPCITVSHYFMNHTILKEAEGAERLHVVNFGKIHGFQWPCLISALAERRGGPPVLRITRFDFPSSGLFAEGRIDETGRRLSEYAATYGVPFEFDAIACNWESVHPSSLDLRPDEHLVVTCMYGLQYLADETVSPAACPRDLVLQKIREMRPKLFVIGVKNAGFSAPFFITRFREALFHFSSMFDWMDTTVGKERAEREIMEREVWGREIMNAVACEGRERVERPELYRQWQARIQRAGFEQLSLGSAMVRRAKALVRASFHKDFVVEDVEGKWLMVGWKGRLMTALSMWTPSP